MSKIDWNYVAGLFEGAGWITTQRRPSRRTIYVNIGLAMNDPEPLLAVRQYIGGGRVNGPYDRAGGGVVEPGSYKQRYVMMLTRREDIDRFLNQIYPLLSPRRREAVIIAMAQDTRGPWEAPV
jgi:hypothetical protein